MGRLLKILGNSFDFELDGSRYRIGQGYLCRTAQERKIVSVFLPPDERHDFIERGNQVPTIDVTFEIDYPTAELLNGTPESIPRFEEFLKTKIPSALKATNWLMEACRMAAHEITSFSSIDMTRDVIHSTRPFKESEFKNYLFYKCSISDRTIVGFIGEGSSHTWSPLTSRDRRSISRYLRKKRNRARIFLLRGIEDYMDEDYPESVLNASYACELASSKFIRKKLQKKGRISDHQIDKFIDDTSRRLLLTVVLSYMTKIDKDLLDKCKDVFELRNSIAHGQRMSVTKQEALDSLNNAQTLMNLINWGE
jgi:hypothetical protein